MRHRPRLAHLIVLAGAALAPAAALPGCASVDELIQDVSSSDAEDRRDALVDLAEGYREGDEEYVLRHSAIIEAVTKALEDPSPLVRQIAIESLAGIGGKDAAGPILSRLEDKDPWVRYQAARQLGALRLEAARAPLESMLARDKSPDVRRQAAESLRWIGDDGSIEALYLGLGDADASVRRKCLEGLVELTGEDRGPDPRAWREVLEGRERERGE